jgi:hypothetical protein
MTVVGYAPFDRDLNLLTLAAGRSAKYLASLGQSPDVVDRKVVPFWSQVGLFTSYDEFIGF